MTEEEAITYLIERGNDVSKIDGGKIVMLAPNTDTQEVTIEDIEAVNSVTDVVEFRVIAFFGIAPEVFEKLRVFPKVKLVAVHYQMPPETLAFFDRFPNTEKILFWADHYISCDHLPPLRKLRILHHESTEGDISMESIRRIAACKDLEEIEILRPVPPSGIELLTNLPKLRHLEVNETTILTDGEQNAAAQRESVGKAD